MADVFERLEALHDLKRVQESQAKQPAAPLGAAAPVVDATVDLFSKDAEQRFQKAAEDRFNRMNPPPKPGKADPYASVRDPAIMTGAILMGTAGAAAGTATMGPGPGTWAGATVGGALGAKVGAHFPETIAEISRFFGADPPKGLPVEEQWAKGNEAASLDALFSAGGTVISHGVAPVVRVGIRRAAGAGTKEAIDLATMARQKYDVNLGIHHFATNPLFQGYAQVIGLFPFVRGPLVEGTQRVTGEVGRVTESITGRIGKPIHEVDRGGLITGKAKEVWEAWKYEIDRRYADWSRQAVREGAKVNPVNTRARAQALYTDYQQNRPRTKAGGMARQSEDPLGSWLREEAMQLADGQTVAQIDDNFIGRINSMMDKYKNDPFTLNRLFQLKQAAKEDMRANLQGSDQLKDGLKAVDDFFERGLRTFESSAAQKIARAERGRMFKPGTSPQGIMNEDELRDFVLRKGQSPTQVQQLYDMIAKHPNGRKNLQGFDLFKNVVASHVDDAVRSGMKSSEQGIAFNVAEFRKSLGLGDPKSAQHATLKKAMSLAGAKIEDLDEAATVIGTAMAKSIPSVSQFIARKGTLGGFRAIVRGVVPTTLTTTAGGTAGFLAGGDAVSTLTGAGTSLMAVVGLRKFSRMLMDPVMMKTARQALDEDAAMGVRRANMLRMFHWFLRDPDIAGDTRDAIIEGISAMRGEELPGLREVEIPIR